MAQITLEERVATLESRFAALKVPKAQPKRRKDWRRTLGMFTGDEVMKRIDAAALEYREADRRKTRRRISKKRPTKS